MRAAQASASTAPAALGPSIAILPVAASVVATDSFPFLTSAGNAQRGTASIIRTYVLAIAGGTANIAENLALGADLSVAGNVTLGNATSDTITPTGRFASDLDPNANNTIDLGASALAYKDGWFAGTLNTADLAVSDDSTLSGDVTFGGPWQHPEVVTGTFTIAAAHNGALLGAVSIAGDIDVAGTLAVLP